MAALHSAPLWTPEIYVTAGEYAIVFEQTPQDEVFPTVVLGIKVDDSLPVPRAGLLPGRFQASFPRTYECAAVESDGRGTLRILAGAGHASELPGARGGSLAPVPPTAATFMQEHQLDRDSTRLLGAELRRLGLLSERVAKLRAATGGHHELKPVLIVDERRLDGLGSANLLSLTRHGYLPLVTAHLKSLGALTFLAPAFQPVEPAVTPAAGAALPKSGTQGRK